MAPKEKQDKKQDKKSLLTDISAKKKEILIMRIKRSSGDTLAAKDIKKTKKEVARLFTKFNA